MRKEINNEITKEIDEDTSEVKSSSVVKWEDNLPMGFHSEEKPTKFNYNNNGFLNKQKRNRNEK